MKSISLFKHNNVTNLSAICLMLNKPPCIRTDFEHIHSAGVQARFRQELEILIVYTWQD